MSGTATGEGIGQPVRRKEDLRLVVGQGRYSDDLNLPGQAYAVMVRSPHAHARIRGIAVDDAVRAPGVIAVLTGADLLADGLRPIPQVQWSGHPAEVVLRLKDGAPALTAPQYPMPADKARYVGEAVAMVIAETLAAAKDGAERVVVDYEPLPAVTDGRAAAAPGAPRLWDHMPSNVCVDAETGDAAATTAAFARAAHVVRFSTQIQRVNGVPMEPRAAIGAFDPASGRFTLHAGSGTTVRLKHELAIVLGVAPDAVRAVMRDVGGNFGTRGGFYPEFALVAWAARRVGRPVKWTCERQEAFLCDYQGRDLHVDVELALDRDGRFRAMRGSNLGNIGAHTASVSSLQKGVEIMSGLYHVPAAHFHARAVVSNTPPTSTKSVVIRVDAIFHLPAEAARVVSSNAAAHSFFNVSIRRLNACSNFSIPSSSNCCVIAFRSMPTLGRRLNTCLASAAPSSRRRAGWPWSR